PTRAKELKETMEATTSLEPPKKHGAGHDAPGGPPGNQYPKKHGVRGLQIARKLGKIDKRTSFGYAFEKRKKEYIAHLGGDGSAMELVIIEDTIWTDFYVTNYDV